MKVNLFGKDVELRDKYCQFYNEEASDVEQPYINLYVRFKGCNANCLFCEFQDNACPFDMEKYLEIVKELSTKLEIRKFGFTGGEPTMVYDKFKEVVMATRELSPTSILSVNTNGLNLTKLFNYKELISTLDNVALSRHHYDEDKNNEILGFKSATNDEIREVQKLHSNPDLLHFSCNLIKGYIDNEEEIFKMLNHANDLNVFRTGLVSLMPVNDYCKDNHIDSNKFELNSRFFNTKRWTNGKVCSCSNYNYMPQDFKEEFVKIYFKRTLGNSPLTNTLVYDGEKLTYGFDGYTIY